MTNEIFFNVLIIFNEWAFENDTIKALGQAFSKNN